MKIMCIIPYQIGDPFKRDAFKKHAETLITVIPNCGHLTAYCLPYEGTNDISWGLIGFETLAAYEIYRGRLKVDPAALEDATWTADQRAILREERNFVQLVDGTFDERPATHGQKKVICLIRYQLNPFKLDHFRKHAETSSSLSRAAAGSCLASTCRTRAPTTSPGPSSSSTASLTMKPYRARLANDADARDDAAWMKGEQAILREERNFVQVVEGTFNIPSALG